MSFGSFLKKIENEFTSPTAIDIEKLFIEKVGEAGGDILAFAKKTIAVMDFTKLAGGDKMGIVTAVIEGALTAEGVTIPSWLTSTLISTLVARLRINPTIATVAENVAAKK